MMHTMQALEKTSRCFLCPVCTHRINISRVLAEKASQHSRKGGGENTHHSTHQTPGSAFLNPRLSLSCYPPPPRFLRLIHPPLATLGHESRLCMTARNIPCHKGFPKVSAFVTLSADKTSPQPLMERTSHFSECVNNFWLAGQTLHPGDVCSVCLRGCLYLLIYMFEYIYVFCVIST